MRMLNNITDRELLENIYVILLLILTRVNEIDDDSKLFTMNVLANLVGDTLIDTKR